MKWIPILSVLLTTGCSVFGIRTSEELKYDVVNKEGSIEIRQYAPYVAAQATLQGERDEVSNGLFRILAGYIFGKNKKQEKIAMTAPVVMDPKEQQESEKIAMTAPVTMQEGDSNSWTMAFSMPSGYTLENLPQPDDSRVNLLAVPEKMFAVIRYSGTFINKEKQTKNAEKLLDWLKENKNYKILGEPSFAGYDPPFTLPFLRRNEVWIPVEVVTQ